LLNRSKCAEECQKWNLIPRGEQGGKEVPYRSKMRAPTIQTLGEGEMDTHSAGSTDREGNRRRQRKIFSRKATGGKTLKKTSRGRERLDVGRHTTSTHRFLERGTPVNAPKELTRRRRKALSPCRIARRHGRVWEKKENSKGGSVIVDVLGSGAEKYPRRRL